MPSTARPGAVSKFPGVPTGTRAAELPDSEVELPSGFLTTFGRPAARESACECERSSGLQLGPRHGPGQRPDDQRRHQRPQATTCKLVKTQADDRKAGRRTVPPDPQPAGDRRGGGLLYPRSSPEIEADHVRLSPRPSAVARPRSPRPAQARNPGSETEIAAAKGRPWPPIEAIAPKLAEAGEARRPPGPSRSRRN